MSSRYGTLRMRRAVALLVAAPALFAGTGYLASNTVAPSHAGVVEVPITITATPTITPAAQTTEAGGDGPAGSPTEAATTRSTPHPTTTTSDTATTRTAPPPTTSSVGAPSSPAE